MSSHDTIAAVATAPGEGAIAVIRISGPKALEIAQSIFSGPVSTYAPHTAHYGKILSAKGETLDTALLLVMKHPRSYTGEDSVEISCHGGSLITRRVLERIFEAGARPAEPGEFSLRAFLNGKLDLAQAEAVQQLIGAKSELALASAEKQLDGALSEKISQFQKELTDIAAIVEAWVDFPEEGLEFASKEEILQTLRTACEKMQHLQTTFHEGKALHEGLSLCLLGTPNVGKSSLMNALLGKERAIVTPIPGTTRDLLEEDFRFCGFPFRLIDTAGIHSAQEIVEQEGIRRSQKAMQEADLIFLLLDASRPLAEQDRYLLETVPRHKTILIWNKMDLSGPSEMILWDPVVHLSVQKRTGFDALRKAVEQLIWKKGPPSKEEIVITQQRHFQALSNAIAHCHKTIDGLGQNISAEFVSSDLRASLNELGKIIGTNVTEDILSAIFSKFCLGK